MTSDLQLTLRPTMIGGVRETDDFTVYFEDRSVGRIRFASEREGYTPGWDWHVNPPLPVPSWCNGTEDDLLRVKAAFREAWERYYASLTPEDVAHWHRTAYARR